MTRPSCSVTSSPYSTAEVTLGGEGGDAAYTQSGSRFMGGAHQEEITHGIRETMIRRPCYMAQNITKHVIPVRWQHSAATVLPSKQPSAEHSSYVTEAISERS